MSNEEPTVHSVGIDLGTTNSLVAVVDKSGNPEIIRSRSQEWYTPSVVAYRSTGEGDEESHYLVGRLALNFARRDPANTVRSVKRFMGLAYDDPQVQVAKEHVAYDVREDSSEKGKLVIRLGGGSATPEEISARLLRHLKEDAEARLQPEPVGYAVITCPAYFSEPQRAATWRAGLLAGLRIKALLDEPTAAALSETRQRDLDRARVLVFDFGGGTLDISLIQISKKAGFQVVSYAGDNFLGGDDIDRAIARHIEDHIYEQGGDLEGDHPKLDFDVLEKAEAAKRAFAGGAESVSIIIPGACRTRDGEILDVDMDIDHQVFSELLEPIEKRVQDVVEKFLRSESIEPSQITEVLMVGGSSAIPEFQDLLRGIFERDGETRVRLAKYPMEAVAFGAALYAKRIRAIICPKCQAELEIDAEVCPECGFDEVQRGDIAWDPEQQPITAKLPWSLGVRYRTAVDSDAYQRILHKGIAYPTAEPSVESFRIPSTDGFNVEIYEGDQARASANRIVSVLEVDQIPSDVEKGDSVEVEFSFDRSRTLFIRLKYPSSRADFRPRWRLKAHSEQQQDPVRDLAEFLPSARRFLDDYREFVDEGTRRKMRDDLDKAEQAVMTGRAEEAKRVHSALHKSMLYSAGVASTLFLAERTIASDDPELGPSIERAANKLRDEYERRDQEMESTRKGLDELVMRALQKRRPDLGSGERPDRPILER